jgi:hypothetical protein
MTKNGDNKLASVTYLTFRVSSLQQFLYLSQMALHSWTIG